MNSLFQCHTHFSAERARALKAKERFARTASGFGSDGSIDGPSRDADRATPVWPESDRRSYDMEFVRPQTVGEEELQLQLAIAMSKEEADQEDQKRRSDDVRLQLALSQSEQDFKVGPDGEIIVEKKTENNLVDLLDAFGSTDLASGGAAASSSSTDPWGMPSKNQPPKNNDLWSSPKPVDPWLPPPPSSSSAAAARTISPAGNSSVIGWNPPTGGVPVLPAKPTLSSSNDLDGAWSMKPPQSSTTSADPWNSKPPQMTQVPNSDPWNAASKPPQADPWNLTNNGTNGAGVSCLNRYMCCK